MAYFLISWFFSCPVICFFSTIFSYLFFSEVRSSLRLETLLLKLSHTSIVLFWLSEALSLICWAILSDDLIAWLAYSVAFFLTLANYSFACCWYFLICYYFCFAIISKFFFWTLIVYLIYSFVFYKSGRNPYIFCFPSLIMSGILSAIFLRSFNDHFPFPMIILK